MAKTKISEFSSTPANNTDIDSINIAEGCAPSGINDAIRELMSQLKDWQAGTSNDPMVIGSSGSLTLNQGTANGVAYLNGSKVVTSGSALTFDGTNLGIGTSSPAAKLDVGYVAGSVALRVSRDANNRLDFYQGGGVSYIDSSPASGQIAFATVGTERMRLDSSGNLGLGVTPSAWLSSQKVLEVSGWSVNAASVTSSLATNAYVNSSSQWIYKTTGFATRYDNVSGQHQWHTAPSGTAGNAITFTQAMTLDASGNLGVGTSSPSTYAKLAVVSTGTSTTTALLNGSGASASNTVSTDYWSGNSFGGLEKIATIGAINPNAGSNNGGALYFSTSANGTATTPTERARIDSSGNLLVSKTTAASLATAGVQIFGGGDAGAVWMTRDNSDVLSINRLTSDGQLVGFSQATTQEGSISVSGTTVSYNGGHLSRWAQTTTAKDESIVKGTVLSNLDAMNVYTDAEGNPVDNEQLNKVKVSDIEGDANVAGVFVNWSHDDAHNVDEINMAMTGDMIIRIAQGTTVARGDLLMSAGNGTAKPQGDDIVRSKTIAKVTSTHVTCTYADGSYCVPCVLMAC